MALADLKKTFIATRKVWREDKTNKAAKKAFKAAKLAYEEAKSKKRPAEEATSESPKKKLKQDSTYAEIRALAKAAKDAWREDKKDPAKRKAFKAAKAALADAKASGLGPDTPKKETKDDKPEGTSDDRPESIPNVKCFVGNLSFDINEGAIRKFFEPLEITEVFWLSDKYTQKFKGMGFLTFSSLEEAAQAVEKNGEELMGRSIRVGYSLPRKPKTARSNAEPRPARKKTMREKIEDREQPADCDTLFVGNLPWDKNDNEKIKEFFKPAKIADIRWLMDGPKFRGAGFIQFESRDDIANAVKLNGSDFGGRPIRLDYAAARMKQ